MFTHQGISRNNSHNLKIASLLSFVAGFVNVVGVISLSRLTTNVTGHFAYFTDEIFKLNFHTAIPFFFYVFFFLLGAFYSSFFIEYFSEKRQANVYVFPLLSEITLLLCIALSGQFLLSFNANYIAYILLFAMGIQNSLVTKISNAVVRTTHLTGLFTDLGIELSQLFFYRLPHQQKQLFDTIKLRLTIISFFFVGGIFGGLCYTAIGFNSFFIPAVLLVIGLYYDTITKKLYLKK